MTLGIGLVGLGLHGTRYANHLAKGDVAGVRLVAVSRRDRARGEAQARELGCGFHANARDLANDRSVDALVVATPADAHGEGVLAALEAGKPVLVEKPLAHSLEEAQALLSARDSSRVVVAQTLRWEPTYRMATQLARELGTLRHAQALFVKGDFAKRATADAQDATHHRAAFACGIHHLDWAGLLFPEGFARAFASGPEDGLALTAILETKTGATFSLTVRLAGEGVHESFAVFGDEGTLVGDRPAHALKKNGQPVEIGPRIATLPSVLATFRDVVLGKIENPVPLAAGVRAVACAEACVRSLAAGAPVTIR